MKYKQPDSHSFLCIPVLEFLKGLPWDVYTKNLLASLRPSSVRESWGSIKCDAQCWRVTVWLYGNTDNPKIDHIEQEVMVGLDGDVAHGHGLYGKLLDMGMEKFR